MSDRTRSPEEIEGEISRRQEELAEDLEDLEYRLSRRGVKDRARDRVTDAAHTLAERANALKESATGSASSAAHTLAERASSLRDEAARRARRFGSRAGEQLTTSGRGAVDRADRNRPIIAVVAGGLAIGLGLYLALRSSGDGHPRRESWRREYATAGPPVPTRSFQYADFGDY